MNKRRKVQVLLRDGIIKECEIEHSEEAPWAICFNGAGFQDRHFLGDDLFEALAKLRRELEANNMCLLCVGSRPDVLASGMSRSMGGGQRVYALDLGKPARRTKMLDIFDFAPPDAVGSVNEQSEFHEKWKESLRHQ
jgi:hypothetical protein